MLLWLKTIWILIGLAYSIDSWTNVPPKILSNLGLNKHLPTNHPLSIIKQCIVNYFYKTYKTSRGEVYRRDEIDSTHYPVFHQLDAVRLVTKDKLFERDPGLEIFERDWSSNLYNSNQNQVLTSSKCMDQTKQSCHTLEAIKLIEHDLKGVLAGLPPPPQYSQCINDLSFWLLPDVQVNEGFAPNDFYDLVRNVAGDVVEQTSLIDQFNHLKKNRTSVYFSIIYRHMERTLTQKEVNDVHKLIAEASVKTFKVEIC
uniref:phenylalanine--tRNA ligase n=1 Tax=Glossina austeni TaxID=7395 RepID=A0A1A9VUU9_GLOAU